MTRAALQASLEGVAFTTATPFTDDLAAVDHDALHENLRAIENAGGSLYIPNGNTGEYYSLTPTERVEVVETVTETVDGCVVAGAGGHVDRVVEYAESYAAAGADGVMIMHPGHPYKHADGLVSYYRAIADRSPLGVVVYKRGGDVPDAAVADVVSHENVAGVKYADANISSFARLTASVDADVTWMNGIAERFAPAFALEGAEGFTTGIGNFVPDQTLALGQAIDSRDWAQARAIRDTLEPYESLRDESGAGNEVGAANNIPAVKAGLDLAGLNGGDPRPPLVALSDADRERARECYDRIQRHGIPS